jgi:hypothetical protein
MKSHERWTEKCDRCKLQAKGTGKEWLDGTRICAFCWSQLVDDLEYAQEKLREMRLTRVYPIIRTHKQVFSLDAPVDTKISNVTMTWDENL